MNFFEWHCPRIGLRATVLALGLWPEANTATLRPIRGQYHQKELITYSTFGMYVQSMDNN